MNIIGDLNEWIFVWYFIEIASLVVVLIRNHLMGKQNKNRYILDKWEKNAMSIMVINVALIGIIAVIKNDEQGHYMNSLFYAVLLFTGALWVSRKFNDDTKRKLEIMDDRLKRIQERLDGLYKK